jgi:heteromeric Ino2p/Ino4p transcription factor
MTPRKRPRTNSSNPPTVAPIPKSQKPPGELLSSEEKRANHIASVRPPPYEKPLTEQEQKRRQAIREGFDRLTEVVPGLGKNQGRSEAIVLDKTIEYLRELLDERRMLIEQVKLHGGKVPEELERL